MPPSAVSLWGMLVLLSVADGVAGKKDSDSVPDHSIPENIRKFYDGIVAKGSCSNTLATGFWATDPGNNCAFVISLLASLSLSVTSRMNGDDLFSM